MGFNPKAVTSLLLPNGWHSVDSGTFRLDANPSATAGPVMVENGLRLPQEMTWHESGEEMRCSYDKIIAVKLGKPS